MRFLQCYQRGCWFTQGSTQSLSSILCYNLFNNCNLYQMLYAALESMALESKHFYSWWKNILDACYLASITLKFDWISHFNFSKNWFLPHKFQLLFLHCHHLNYKMNSSNNIFNTSKVFNYIQISTKSWTISLDWLMCLLALE